MAKRNRQKQKKRSRPESSRECPEPVSSCVWTPLSKAQDSVADTSPPLLEPLSPSPASGRLTVIRLTHR